MSPPAIVLLHGAVLNHRMWDPVVTDLGPDYRALAPDLPGHGTRAGEPFRLGAAVDQVRDLVRSIAPTPVVLVGDSLGSYVAIATLASLGPELRGAFLGGCTARFQGLGIVPYLVDMALARMVPRARLVAALEDKIRNGFPAAAGILQAGIRPAAFAQAVHELRRLDARAALAQARIPIELVNGATDWRHRIAESAVTVGGRAPTIHRIPDTGHGVSLLRPREFAGLLRRFVDRC